MTRKKPSKKPQINFGARKLTQAVHDGIVAAVRAGVPRSAAAGAVNITQRCLQYWLKEGRSQTKGPLFRLFRDVQKAESDAVGRNVAIIQRAAQGGVTTERRTVTRADGTVEVTERVAEPIWTAAAWWLERRHAKHFGRRDATTHKIEGAKGKASFQLVIDEGPDEVDPPADLPRE